VRSQAWQRDTRQRHTPVLIPLSAAHDDLASIEIYVLHS
jgi:hypothetical protein